MCFGSLILLPATYFAPHSYAEVLLFVAGPRIFNNGIFSGFLSTFPSCTRRASEPQGPASV